MSERPAPREEAPLGRRAFLGVVGVGLTSLVWGGEVLDGASSVLPKSVQAAVPIGGRFRIYSVNPPYPRFDPATWRLTVGGLVDREVSFSLADLRSMPLAEQTSDFHCVTGWSVLGCRWRGVRIADVLREAGLRPQARALRFVSSEEPYDDALSLQQLKAPDAMLALDLNGEPLTREMGAPVRVVMPRMYAYKGVKWLARIEATDRIVDGYWEQRGYDRDAWLDGVERS